ncbi:ParB/RepB/Spo0J family partition protein [Lysinibacillus pakistanensis]|uniref:ParB/RepB/Spo0J family partition protein n=1 Tax=Lysinibacillus pakistanensis TaxID=759811 RepID=A0AAX3WPT3_9BACI|nr:ParB/RepB/Spo0J family partition protein [Lysinibacillus pakistanensis]MDM5234255.1 ParB/RepB/Spo0J family partition protein [Lysinibacillus pakistanensis]WHY44846.1 ParB/RepB/Spo0J family partition protein [Lysinibacillus pakistanensis]WHY49853.1 ParB/RepB/Spo0J family partition protein [Lysinibacillus pakistanensis]
MTQVNEVVEVSVSQLSEHSLQSQFSPDMKTKDWAKFLTEIKRNGILQPLFATKGFKVIDGRHRLKAAKELGIENVNVVFVDIPENEIASYITATKLLRDALTKGQRACLVLNLHEYEFRSGQGKRTDLSQKCEKLDTHKMLAEQASISKGSMGNLISVKRNRPDLYDKVFDGSYSIGKAHAQMKLDEAPPTTEEERQEELDERSSQIVKNISKGELGQAQFDESLPMTSPHNTAVSLRKAALSATATVLNNTGKLKEVEEIILKKCKKALYITQVLTI